MRLTEHVTCIWERRDPYKVLVKNLDERENLEGLDADEKTMLNLILNKSLGIAWAALIWFRIRRSGGLL